MSGFWNLRALAQRLGCGRAELAALAVLAAGTLLALGLLWLAARPEPDAAMTAGDPPGVPAADAPAGGTGSEGPLAVEGAEVVVHVAGRVRRPGVYTLPAGARVADALDAAGGALPRAALASLNLARPLTDGEQLLVVFRGENSAPAPGPPLPGAGAPATGASGQVAPAGPEAHATPTAPLALNQASASHLEELPGIGPVLAERIVAHRDQIGGFTDVGQLRDVPGIGEKTFQALAGLVTP